MIIHVIFGQRNERYEGEYAPEALDVMTEYAYSDNPDWLNTKFKEYQKSEEFSSLEIIQIEIADKKLDEILYKKDNKLNGDIKNKS